MDLGVGEVLSIASRYFKRVNNATPYLMVAYAAYQVVEFIIERCAQRENGMQANYPMDIMVVRRRRNNDGYQNQSENSAQNRNQMNEIQSNIQVPQMEVNNYQVEFVSDNEDEPIELSNYQVEFPDSDEGSDVIIVGESNFPSQSSHTDETLSCTSLNIDRSSDISDNLDSSCFICMKSLGDPSKQVASLPTCPHRFHLNCITSVLRLIGACPVCKNHILSPI